MRKLFLLLVAAVGLVGFTAVAQAGCSGMEEPLKTADVESPTVATGTPVTPLPTQSGG